VPCRRGEAARLDWSHLDLAMAEWRQPSHMTMNRDPHRLHLHVLALEVLQARRKALAETQADGDLQKAARFLATGMPRAGLVFPAPVSGGVVDTFTAIKAALVAKTGPQDGEEGPPPLAGHDTTSAGPLPPHWERRVSRKRWPTPC
jgi:integrase